MSNAFPDLPTVSPTYARLSRLLAVRQTRFNITLAEQTGQLTLAASDTPVAKGYQLILSVNNETLPVSVDEQMLTLLLPGRLEHFAATKLPKELIMAALMTGINETLHHLCDVFNIPVTLEGFDSSSGEPVSGGLSLVVQVNGITCGASVPANETTLSLLQQLPFYAQCPVPAIPFVARLELGRSLLTKAEFGNLDVGDIIFLKQHVSGQQLILRFNHRTAFLAEADGNHVTIEQRMAPMDEAHDFDEQHGAEGSVDLSDMAVELLFEIGSQQFNVSDLQNIQPGYVFELDRSMEQPVRIRANGKVIAECQLVQIDNRLGAKITQLKQ